MATVLDYSDARPSPAAVKAAGAVGVGRYIGLGSRAKRLTTGERDDLFGAGLGIVPIAEGAADWARGGMASGRSVAAAVAEDRAKLGIPTTQCVYYAIDFDATWAQVGGALAGVAAVDPAAGTYGSAAIVKEAHADPADRWQTVAWSHGRKVPCALYQHAGGSPIPGTDLNDLNDPTVLWTPTPAPTPPEDDMPLPLAVRSDKDGSVWVTTVDPKPARYHIPNADQLDALLVLGAVRVNGQGGAPAVVAQSFLDTIPTVT